MPVMKYSEIALAVAFAVLTSAAWLLQPPLTLARSSTSTASSLKPMIVVIITGKRMSQEEKQRSLALQ